MTELTRPEDTNMANQELRFPANVNYIAVEGVIGAGKTALCSLLAERCNARLVLEDIEGNPFLSKFYTDRRSLGFQTQLFFLLSRHRQLSSLVVQQDLFQKITISDYMFSKDRIFANINLDDDELSLYNTVATLLEASIPSPDLVVYLQASLKVLQKRIDKRGRSFEFNMDNGYLELLSEAYNHFFFHYSVSPVLVINTDEIDFVADSGDLDEIINQIVRARPGTNFYKPLGSKNRSIIRERQGENNNLKLENG